jgi:hypothetical protein
VTIAVTVLFQQRSGMDIEITSEKQQELLKQGAHYLQAFHLEYENDPASRRTELAITSHAVSPQRIQVGRSKSQYHRRQGMCDL